MILKSGEHETLSNASELESRDTTDTFHLEVRSSHTRVARTATFR